MKEPPSRDEVAWIVQTIGRILKECPRRQATTESERRGQEILAEAFAAQGLPLEWHEFRFNASLYQALAVNFGVGVLGSVLGTFVPPVGAALHALAAGSYWADSARRRYVLRRLLPFRRSQNLLATLPATTGAEPTLRVVFLGHIDAAFTGWLFQPETIKRFATEPPRPLRFMKRSLAVATRAEAALAASNAVRTVLGPFGLALLPVEAVLAVPGLLAFLLNLEIVLRNEVVPGVADNLTGAVALPVLARRLARTKRPDVELVFVATGCEEAGLGGAAALVRDREGVWDRERTVVLALDTLTNGALKYLSAEGEVVQTSVAAWLRQVIEGLVAADPRFAHVEGFEPPVGGSDAIPFLVRGWDAVGITCVDDELGAPLQYHCATDDLEHMDRVQLPQSLDFVEALVDAIVTHRLG